MTKGNFTKRLTAFLCAGTVLCSLFQFNLLAIIMFSALCIARPSPLLGIIPIVSLAISVFSGYAEGSAEQAITMGISSLSFVLPSVLIAVSYFSKYSKFTTVINAAFGLFIYTIPKVVTAFFLQFGSFSKEIFNSVIDGIISDTKAMMIEQVSAFTEEGQMVLSYVDAVEQALYMMKPLLPAMYITICFASAYIAVCCVNVILKATKIIEKKSYILMPPWQLGIIFFICVFLNTFLNSFSFVSVITASVQMIFVPIYVIVSFSLIYNSLLKATKNKIVATIIIVAGAFTLLSPIIYNLLYLIGCSYSIMYGIKSKQSNTKGGTL